MRKLVLAFLLTGLCLCAFAQNGVIRQVSGTVELKRAGDTGYVPAKAGDLVSGNTIISTGFKSSALIEIGGATITVRPVTRLTVTEISASGNDESLQVSLRTGSVQVAVTPPAGGRASTTVRSPNATASVRGTNFYFDARNLHVTQGTVLFKGNRGYTVQAGAGTTTVVAVNETASAPQSTTGYQDSAIAGWDPAATASGGTEAVFSLTPGSPGTASVGVEY